MDGKRALGTGETEQNRYGGRRLEAAPGVAERKMPRPPAAGGHHRTGVKGEDDV